MLPLESMKDLHKQYHQSQETTSGIQVFNHVCVDFKPHCITSLRDIWCDRFMMSMNPLRQYYKYLYMPTMDSSPVKPAWLSDYISCDAVLTYSLWAQEELKKEGGGLINLCGATLPPSNRNIFKPYPDKDKDKVKEMLGFKKDSNIIGTVMRNQRRKLFDDLFFSFSELLKKMSNEEAQKTYLYCHTSLMDLGYQLEPLLLRHNIYNKVVFTYKCHNPKCGIIFPHVVCGAATQCPKCKQKSARTAKTDDGVDSQTLNLIYNSFDIYVQWANAEGQGVPCVEASCVGLPIITMNHTALNDYRITAAAIGLDPVKMSLDVDIQAYRCSAANNTQLTEELYKFFKKSKSARQLITKRVLEASNKYYNYDRCVKFWTDYFDNLDIKKIEKKWHSPADIKTPNLNIPNIIKHSDFLQWCFKNVLYKPEFCNSYFEMEILKKLNLGIEPKAKNTHWNPFTENSYVGHSTYSSINREHVLNYFRQLRNDYNIWEQIRTGGVPNEHEILKHKVMKKQ